MDKKEKDISEFIKSNVNLPNIVDEKINSAFKKIKSERREKDMKNKNVFGKVAAIIALIFLCGNAVSLAFGGANIYTMIYEYFKVPEEEKVNDITIEGMKEDVNYVGIKSSIGYTIQYDEEALKLSRENEKDVYRVNIEDIKDKVYFTVEYLETPYEELKNENKNNNIEKVEINGQKAFIVTFIDDILSSENQNFTWDSDVKTLWYIDANNGTYFIEEHYFFEATEGWGVRIAQMLNTFKIVENIEN